MSDAPPPPPWQPNDQPPPPPPGVQQQAPPPPQWGGAQPGYQYQQAPVPMVNDPRKSKVAAGILGICLGAFGVHNFYLGYTGKAIAQLLITVLSCGILAVVSGIWGLVEGIMILTGSISTDAAGVPLKD